MWFYVLLLLVIRNIEEEIVEKLRKDCCEIYVILIVFKISFLYKIVYYCVLLIF